MRDVIFQIKWQKAFVYGETDLLGVSGVQFNNPAELNMSVSCTCTRNISAYPRDKGSSVKGLSTAHRKETVHRTRRTKRTAQTKVTAHGTGQERENDRFVSLSYPVVCAVSFTSTMHQL